MNGYKVYTPPPINDSPPPSRRKAHVDRLRRLTRQQLEERLEDASARGDEANQMVFEMLLDELDGSVYAMIRGGGYGR